MRCFIGIDLPKSLKNDIKKSMNSIDKSNLLYGKFVETENLHISLKFLGEVEDDVIETIKKSLAKTKSKPFICSIKGIGAFPSNHYVKVLWFGIDKGANEILNLKKEVDSNTSSFRKDSHFKPHLTLARIKGISSKEKVAELFEKNKDISFEDFQVNSFCLFTSTLTPNGPIYEKISKFNLN